MNIFGVIQKFQETRLDFYKKDITQLERDSNSASIVAEDHKDRWFYELFQNCDDANSKIVHLHINSDEIIVADCGNGINPEIIGDLCGTYSSHKKYATIGRKGIGFKSVYELTDNPIILTQNNEGMEFSKRKTKEWLKDNNLEEPKSGGIFQWIPFFKDRNEFESKRQDQIVLNKYVTYIYLPLKKDKNINFDEIINWPSYSLFPFNNVNELEIVKDNNTIKHIIIEPPIDKTNSNIFTIKDTKHQNGLLKWAVNKQKNIKPPERCIIDLNLEDKERVEKDGISILVGAPLNNNDDIVPLTEYPQLYVYYETEEPSPIKLLLHADFRTKGDRTKLVKDDKLNSWIFETLSQYVIDFVNNAFVQSNPSKNIEMLLPNLSRYSNNSTKELWEQIIKAGTNKLLLGDVASNNILCCSNALYIDKKQNDVNARTILLKTKYRESLLHESYDDKIEILRHFLNKDNAINDLYVVKVISEELINNENDIDWLCHCWLWLLEWIGKETSLSKKEKVNIFIELSIVPVGDHLLSMKSIGDKIVTWQDDEENELPDWMPVVYLNKWFVEKIRSGLISDLSLANIGINKTENIIHDALGKAIKRHWDNKDKGTSKYLEYIVTNELFNENEHAPESIQDCPIPVKCEHSEEIQWVKAKNGYLGKEWGNDSFYELMKDNVKVPWVQNNINNFSIENSKSILIGLGCIEYPKLVEYDKNITKREYYAEWNSYVINNTNYNYTPKIKDFKDIDLANINEKTKVLVIELLSKYWDIYYSRQLKVNDQYVKYYSRRWRSFSCNYDSLWYYALQNVFVPPLKTGLFVKPLSQCWILDDENEMDMILPVVNADLFKREKDSIIRWLTYELKVQRNISDIKITEWKEILEERIVKAFPVNILNDSKNTSRSNKINQVKEIYELCLNNIRGKEISKLFNSSSFLGKKGSKVGYEINELYLNDDDSYAKTFKDDIWIFDINSRLKKDVKSIFGIKSLRDCTEKVIDNNENIANISKDISEELLKVIDLTLPYIYALRSEEVKDSIGIKDKLEKLIIKTLPKIEIKLQLGKYIHNIEPDYEIIDNIIYIKSEKQEAVVLSMAIAEYMNIPSDAEIYEILLNIRTEEEKKKRVMARGVTEEQLNRHLLDFNKIKEPSKEPTIQVVPIQTIDAVPPVKPAQSVDEVPFEGQTPPAEYEPPVVQGPQAIPLPPTGTTKPMVSGDENYKIKNGDIKYIIKTVKPEIRMDGGGGGGGGGGGDRPNLTYEQKIAIEDASRIVVQKELEKQEYKVEQMPRENKGYDILATKEHETIKIEVKGHLNGCKVVDFTVSEYREYLKSEDDKKYKWELWNVEYLMDTGDEKPAELTRYSKIPEEAIEVSTLKLYLNKCTEANSNIIAHA